MSNTEANRSAIEENKPKQSLALWKKVILLCIGLAWIIFQLYIAVIKPLDHWVQIPVHLCLALSVTFLFNSLADTVKGKLTKIICWIIDILIQIGIIYIAWYFISHLEYLQNRIYNIDIMTTQDILCAYLVLVILMEAVRRTMGLTLFIFILVFIGYAFLGQHLTGVFQFRGMDWKQFGELMIMNSQGIFGAPLATSVKTLYYFLLFGAFFSACGSGQVLIDLGMKLSNKSAGGPAKASIISSGLMGMVSGSAMANVSTTGVITIPLMKRAGYDAEQAASIEAVASTGGQIMPPIMGVGAFIMAEMIGVSYLKIAAAAIIPALAYYGSVFLLVHLIAKRKTMTQGNEDLKYDGPPILPRLYLLLPIIVLVILILSGLSLTTCALFSTAIAIAVSFFSKNTRFTVSTFLSTFLRGTKQAANIAIPTGACGIMIGIVVQSGVANKLTKIISNTGSSNIALALILAMLGCMLLGMALPTAAAYLISYVLFGSTLTSLGISVIATNMFMFYFGVIAQITPPVCLASFTAAGIAEGSSKKTGWMAFSYALVSFLVPYTFVFKNELLMQGSTGSIIIAVLILAWGIVFISSGVSGYMFVPIHNIFIRIALVVVAILIIIPGYITLAIGSIIGILLIAYQFIRQKKGVEKIAAS